jgi:anaphase-promoting complex subunit 6
MVQLGPCLPSSSVKYSVIALIHLLLTFIYYRLLNYDRALRCFENALVRNPKNSDARASVGMIYHLKGQTARAIAEYHEALDNTSAGEVINQLLDIALLSKVNTPYARNRDSCLNDTFDVFQMADSTRQAKDEVELELTEDDWHIHNKARSPSTFISRSTLVTEDSLIQDEGDLRLNMSRGWI